MGIFSKIFGRENEKVEELKESDRIVYVEPNDKLRVASEKAQQSFKYFWRELYWERRRIVPAHNFAMVKIPFQQKFNDSDEPIVEHMWVDQIVFDGENIKGKLVNSPNDLTNVKNGDIITRRIDEIGDWMFAIGDKPYGGFTVQAMRSDINESERKNHDKAWGLDFGDYNDILIVYKWVK